MRERRPTSTSNFGVGTAREPRRDRLLRALPAARAVGATTRCSHRSRSPSRSCAATPVRWTSSPTARSRWSSRRRRTSPASSTRRSSRAKGVPSSYLEYLELLHRRVRRVRAQARARRPHRGQRRQPRPQALPQPVGRRHPHPAGPTRAAAARRDHLAEGRGRERLVRVGIVPQRGEPGAARPHRAGRRRQQGPVRPGSQSEEAKRPRGCPTSRR